MTGILAPGFFSPANTETLPPRPTDGLIAVRDFSQFATYESADPGNVYNNFLAASDDWGVPGQQNLWEGTHAFNYFATEPGGNFGSDIYGPSPKIPPPAISSVPACWYYSLDDSSPPNGPGVWAGPSQGRHPGGAFLAFHRNNVAGDYYGQYGGQPRAYAFLNDAFSGNKNEFARPSPASLPNAWRQPEHGMKLWSGLSLWVPQHTSDSLVDPADSHSRYSGSFYSIFGWHGVPSPDPPHHEGSETINLQLGYVRAVDGFGFTGPALTMSRAAQWRDSQPGDAGFWEYFNTFYDWAVPLLTDQWIDIEFYIDWKHSADGAGYGELNVWVNNLPVHASGPVDISGHTKGFDIEGNPVTISPAGYFKIGQYRQPGKTHETTVYFSEIRFGDADLGATRDTVSARYSA